MILETLLIRHYFVILNTRNYNQNDAQFYEWLYEIFRLTISALYSVLSGGISDEWSIVNEKEREQWFKW